MQTLDSKKLNFYGSKDFFSKCDIIIVLNNTNNIILFVSEVMISTINIFIYKLYVQQFLTVIETGKYLFFGFKHTQN